MRISQWPVLWHLSHKIAQKKCFPPFYIKLMSQHVKKFHLFWSLHFLPYFISLLFSSVPDSWLGNKSFSPVEAHSHGVCDLEMLEAFSSALRSLTERLHVSSGPVRAVLIFKAHSRCPVYLGPQQKQFACWGLCVSGYDKSWFLKQWSSRGLRIQSLQKIINRFTFCL